MNGESEQITGARAGTGGANASALAALTSLVGREVELDHFHEVLRTTARDLGPDLQFGTCLITCSDEFQGDLRQGFQRDVAEPLMAQQELGAHSAFEISNLGGRMEPGTLALLDDHFSRPEVPGGELFVIHLSSHLGRHVDAGRVEYGFGDRFGRRSLCCGALAAVLQPPAAARVLNLPWLAQLLETFGPRRLAELQASPADVRPIRQAVVQAVLQAEAVMTEVWRTPPAAGLSLLLVASVTINQQDDDGVLPVGCHLLQSDGEGARFLGGTSLHSSPAALSVDRSQDRLRIEFQERAEPADLVPAFTPERRSLPFPIPAEHAARVRQRLGLLRARMAELGADAGLRRSHARPLLRGILQSLSMIAPELGLAVIWMAACEELTSADELQELARLGPESAQARALLRQAESRVQQLTHLEALGILELLGASDTHLLGS